MLVVAGRRGPPVALDVGKHVLQPAQLGGRDADHLLEHPGGQRGGVGLGGSVACGGGLGDDLAQVGRSALEDRGLVGRGQAVGVGEHAEDDVELRVRDRLDQAVRADEAVELGKTGGREREDPARRPSAFRPLLDLNEPVALKLSQDVVDVLLGQLDPQVRARLGERAHDLVTVRWPH